MQLLVARAVGLGVLSVVLSGLAGVAFLASADAPETTMAPGSPVRPATEPLGRTLFQVKGCSGCHALAGLSSSRIGPDLTNLPSVAGERRLGYSAEAYVRESILDPQAFVVTGYGSIAMPRLPANDEEADVLVTFLLAR